MTTAEPWIAIHESGHATWAITHGVSFRCVSVLPAIGSKGRITSRSAEDVAQNPSVLERRSRTREEALREAELTLAGIAAESIWDESTPYGSKWEWREAQLYFEDAGMGAHEVITAFGNVHEFLKKPEIWRGLAVLALELLARGEVGYEDARRTILMEDF